jgi:5-methylcytosine-specific restriction endonuclease McrA
MKLTKEIRELVYNKCGGHCAYCGVEITSKQMQVDHIEPHWHNKLLSRG